MAAVGGDMRVPVKSHTASVTLLAPQPFAALRLPRVASPYFHHRHVCFHSELGIKLGSGYARKLALRNRFIVI